MKNLTKALLALLTFAFTISFTSCLDSDNSDDVGSSIQPGTEEYTNYLMMVSGSYSGKMYFYNDTIKITSTNKSKVDSVDVFVDVRGVRDSMIYTSIPANYLMKSVTGNEELVKELGSRPVSVSMKYYLYQVANEVLYFGVYPYESKVSVADTDGNHEVTFEFVNYVNYWGAYRKNAMQIQMLLSKIKMDGKVLKEFSQEEMSTSAVYLFDLEKGW